VYTYEQPVYGNWNHRHRHHWRNDRRGPFGDRDHDGVINRFDRAPNNPHRR
jgi:hypothetical protein